MVSSELFIDVCVSFHIRAFIHWCRKEYWYLLIESMYGNIKSAYIQSCIVMMWILHVNNPIVKWGVTLKYKNWTSFKFTKCFAIKHLTIFEIILFLIVFLLP